MSDRTDEQICADLATCDAAEKWSDRYHDAVVRLLHAVGPLLDRAQRAEVEMKRVRNDLVDMQAAHAAAMRDRDVAIQQREKMRGQRDGALGMNAREIRARDAHRAERDQALADLAHLREIVGKLREWANYSPTGRHTPAEIWPGLAALLDEAAPPTPDIDLAAVLRPDPDLMGSPEGDTKGLQELRDAAAPSAPEPPTKPEARQWELGPWTSMADTTPLRTRAEQIVAWVNANGGEAWYEPERSGVSGRFATQPARIALRRADGTEAFAEPGDWIVMGRKTLLGAPVAEEMEDGPDIRRDFFPSKEQPS